MNTEDFVKTAGLWPQKDEIGLWQWRVSSEVQPRIRRFTAFIQEVLTSPVQDAGALAARLVCLDGITPRSLLEIVRQCVMPYQIAECVVLEWEELTPPRTERRELSRLTAAVWPFTMNEAGVTSCIAPANMVKGLDLFLGNSAAYRSFADRTNELERDAICWWYQGLPAPLFAHQSGLQVLSALPRSALARMCKKWAVIHPLPEGQNPDEASDTDLGFTAELIDSASFSDGSDKSPVVLQQGIDLMTITGQEVDGMTKRRWAQSLFDLQSRSQAAGPLTSLLLAWGLDLCEHGTVGHSNLARSTVRQYFRRAAMPLFEALRLMTQKYDSTEWSAEVMHASYVGLMTAQSTGNKKTMASALTSFHSFLADWFDLEPMAMELHTEVPIARVHAQVIWPHEIDLVMLWLKQVDDERVRISAMTMLSIAHESPARTNELLRLRIANVREGCDERGPCLEIEVARRAVLGRLKTPAAQRRLLIHDQATIHLIKSWIERRTSEGAPLTAYLFGDPDDDSCIHRGGAVVSLLNRLLKAATGEPGARIHQLRHGAINAHLDDHLNSASVMDLNRISITATEAGHASAVSTFKSYFHVYESSLRHDLDSALLELIAVTSAQAAPHLNLKSATLRQQAHRKDMNLEEFIWWQLREIPIANLFADVAEPFGWLAPAMPKLLPRANLALTAAVALSWLQELLDGTSEEVLALRYGVAQKSLEKMSQNFKSFCLHLARSAWPRRFTVQSPPPADLGHALSMAEFDLARAHQRKFDKLEDWLSQEQALPVLRDACASWLACRQGSYIALDRSGQVLGLYKLLLDAKVDPHNLRLCIERTTLDDPQQRSLNEAGKLQRALIREVVIADFLTVFGVRPRESSPQARVDRPSAYLQWDDPEHLEEPSSASSSCAGLDAWMGAAAAALLSMKVAQS